ncbi:MAG: hemolysin family protein [Leptospirales bacterium]
MILHITIISVAVITSAFFSGAEIALLGATPFGVTRKNKSRLLKLYHQKDNLIASMVIGNNFSIVAATLFLDTLISQYSDSVTGKVIAFTSEILLFFFLAEALPKSVFRKLHSHVLLYTAPVIWFFHYLLMPIGLFFRLATHFFIKLFPKKGGNKEDFVYFLGSHFIQEKRPISRGLLSLSKTASLEIMTPLPDLYSIHKDSSVQETLSLLDKTRYSRYPVFKNRGDQIIGYVNVADFLKLKLSSKISGVMKPAIFVPETLSADRLLFKMQNEKNPVVFVVNEYGSVSGMISLENIAEEIVGDEIISLEQQQEKPDIVELPGQEFQLDGNLDVDDFNDKFNVIIPKEGFETISGYILFALHKIPETGEVLKTDFGTFSIEKADETTIHTILFKPWRDQN